jgi:hypothetical protein
VVLTAGPDSARYEAGGLNIVGAGGFNAGLAHNYGSFNGAGNGSPFGH